MKTTTLVPAALVAGLSTSKAQLPDPGMMVDLKNTALVITEEYKSYINDGKTVVSSPHKVFGPETNDLVLLLHGFPTSSHMFRNLIPALADKWHVVAPDYPGYGQSSMPTVDEFDYTFDHMAKLVESFTEKLELDHYSL